MHTRLLKHILLFVLLGSMSFSQSSWANQGRDSQFGKIEELIVLQEKSEKLGAEISKAIKRGKVMSGGQINRLSKTIDQYHNLLSPLIVEAHLNPLASKNDGPYSLDLYSLMIHAEVTRQIFSLLKTYFQDHDLRRLVTEMMRHHPIEDNIVKESFDKAKYFLTKKSIDRMIKKLKMIEHELEARGTQNFSDTEIKYLSIIFRDDLTPKLRKGPKLPHRGKIFLDLTASAINNLTEYGSWLVGNAAGNINWRQGYLKKHPKTILKIQKSLRPFDILVEKAPFILTDYMIPGHFGHAALYLGTETQLREMGLWEHPSVIPYQSQISAGYNIIEAVRSGVRLTSLDHFANVDELAILRVKKISEPEQVISIALKQIIKDYDFNFDVRNPLSLICSELIYLSLGHISWPTETILGRPTVSPDHLVELTFYRQSPIEFVGYWGASSKFVMQHRQLDLASRVNFFPVGLTSELETKYNRQVQRCEKNIHPRIRINSTRSGQLETSVCTTESIVNTYQDEDMDSNDYKNWLRSVSR